MKSGINEYLAALKGSAKFGPQVVYHHQIREVDPSFGKLSDTLEGHVRNILESNGITSLYSHQEEAINLIQEGHDVIIATPTASGKSMIYNLPVLSDLLQNTNNHNLYIFPLKALAQDQNKILRDLFRKLPEWVQIENEKLSALYDGDTNSYQRRKIRENPPHVLLTNPEMLHLSLLPYHQSWIEFFSRLKYVVIDEVHSYRGILGSHMAWVIRRLCRIASYYGARPKFILLSATIGNPEQLGSTLINRKIKVISQSGAPQAEKNILFLNPWDSAAYTASQLLEAAVKRRLRTIVYTQSRKLTELINLWTRPRLGPLADKLSAYRAGFLPEERREIESLLFSGDLLGVISTSALELGIDIGDLDLCILVGYPGSIMATWQRGGRVGRGMRTSAIILIGQEDALDQHFMRTPEDFFARTPESAVLNPYNSSIMEQHLVCCAAEKTLEAKEQLLRTRSIKQKIAVLNQRGTLLETASGNSWVASRKRPQRHITLRGDGVQMSIIDEQKGEIIGEIDVSRAMKECHPEAVYLHRAVTWVCSSFDLHANEVIVRQEKPNYFTRPTSEKQTEILEILSAKTTFNISVSFGRLRVRERVTGYQKRNIHTHKLIATFPLDLPEQIIETEGVWIDIPAEIVAEMEKEKRHFMGAIHALEHGMIALFPLLVLCDRNDIGGISCPLHEQTESASIFIYDGYSGGVGLAKEAYEKIDALLHQSQATIATCTCKTGCPSCVHSPKCGSGNRPIDKDGCLHLLKKIFAYNTHPDKHIPGKKENDSKPISPNTIQPDLLESSVNEIERKGVDVLPVRYGVFDLETIRSADEVGGWGRVERMGMSVGVVYDGESDTYRTYLEDETDQLIEHLVSLDLIIGFNNKRFDNRVLRKYTKADLHSLPTLDLLEEVHSYLGYRLSLNGLADQTLGVQKSADGLQALQWYKEGRIDLIQKYCRRDVEITKQLLLFCLESGYLVFQNKAGKKVRLPLALDKKILQIMHKNSAHH